MKIRKGYKLGVLFISIVLLAGIITEIIDPLIPTAIESVMAQVPVLTRQYTTSSAAAQTSVGLIGNGVVVHRLLWNIVPGSGAISACTVSLQQANNNATWNTLIPTQTCTSSGSSDFIPFNANFIRVNVLTLTATGNAAVTFRWEGYYPNVPLESYGNSAYIMTSVADHIVKAAPGVLVGMVFGTSTGIATVSCYDSATAAPVAPSASSASGNYIMATTNVVTGAMPLNVRFSSGLSCSLAGTVTNITVLYR